MHVNPQIFRANDIRGHAEDDLHDEAVVAIGKAFGTMLKKAGSTKAIVARDNRVSSDRIRNALEKGICSTGIDVEDIGLQPTPVFYFARYHLGVPSGVMITGSHNPPDMNGLKLVHNNQAMVGDKILELRNIIEAESFVEGSGDISTGSVLPIYREAVRKLTVLNRPLKVVVDSGNGMAGLVAPDLFRQIGAEVTELYSELDGTFPNHFPDPTIPESLKDLIRKVKEVGADVGVAFDGDADRVGIVDDRGRIIWGDTMLALFFREVADKNQGRPVVVEVKCSQATFEDIENHGGKPMFWKTGHALIEDKMHETEAAMAGEMSGHLYFGDEYYPYDDGIYSGARMLRLIASQDKTLAELVDAIPSYKATPEFRVTCDDSNKFVVLEKAVKSLEEKYPDSLTIDGIRVNFADGWALVRCSQTSPRIIVRAEGKTIEQRDEYLKVIRDELAKYEGVDLTPLDQYLAGDEVTSH